jgi:hypothetical protein
MKNSNEIPRLLLVPRGWTVAPLRNGVLDMLNGQEIRKSFYDWCAGLDGAVALVEVPDMEYEGWLRYAVAFELELEAMQYQLTYTEMDTSRSRHKRLAMHVSWKDKDDGSAT